MDAPGKTSVNRTFRFWSNRTKVDRRELRWGSRRCSDELLENSHMEDVVKPGLGR
jgi:hypothetical protein